MDFAAGRSRKLVSMNYGKESVRFRYPESTIKLLALIDAHLFPLRQLEDFTKMLTNRVKG
jgi:hypothetical protein